MTKKEIFQEWKKLNKELKEKGLLKSPLVQEKDYNNYTKNEMIVIHNVLYNLKESNK